MFSHETKLHKNVYTEAHVKKYDSIVCWNCKHSIFQRTVSLLSGDVSIGRNNKLLSSLHVYYGIG